jgi:glyoxylate/hydroxypyruvate reductase
MALLFRSTVDSAARWRDQLTRLAEELDIRVWPEIGDPADVDYALVWRPEPGFLASLPNLKLILSLGAGSTTCSATRNCRAICRSSGSSTPT